ncbi:MAG: prolyl oligopeptidase family serine peptidase, partial [Kangiellaceae bacterium]|nr:prolyl oligopeptidase family serine peptidase [Kangiellaceae bacterium]
LFELEYKREELQFNESKIRKLGILVDPISNDNEHVLFAEFINEDEGLKVYKSKISDLIDETTENYEKLNTGVEKANWYLSSEQKIRIARVDDEDTQKLYFKGKQSEQWKLIYERESHLDIFKPIDVLVDDSIIAISNLERDKTAVVKVNASNVRNAEVLFESDVYDITHAKFDKKLNKLEYVVSNFLGAPSVDYLIDESNKSLKILQNEFGNEKLYRVSESRDGKNGIFYVISNDQPGRYIHVDRKGHKHRLLYQEIDSLDSEMLAKNELLSLRNESGGLLEAFITLPQYKSEKYPLVVMPHGGPIGIRDNDLFSREVQYLANRGFAVLRVNFRGSFGYGKKYLEAGVSQWGKGIEKDIDLALSESLKQFPIDAENVCIIGGSYGGYSALMSTIKYHNRYKCVVSYFGVTDLNLLYSSSVRTQIKQVKESIDKVVGDVLSNPEQAKLHSPVFIADKINVPVLLMAGKRDFRAHVEHTERLDYVLNILGKESNYVEYPESGHGHPNWLGMRHQFIRIIDFLNQHLKNPKPITDQNKKILAKDYFFVAREQRKDGVAPSDRDEVFQYTKKAADLSHPEAMHDLAYFLEKGIHLEKNLEESISLYGRAAKKDNLKAVLRLAKIYRYGLLGVARDSSRAFRYYEQAYRLNSFTGAWEMGKILICQGKKTQALEAVESLKSKAKDYSDRSVHLMRNYSKEDLECG